MSPMSDDTERRSPDQDTAVEQALLDGTLPDHDRRISDIADAGASFYRDNATTNAVKVDPGHTPNDSTHIVGSGIPKLDPALAAELLEAEAKVEAILAEVKADIAAEGHADG